jgi:hypothetical protein
MHIAIIGIIIMLTLTSCSPSAPTNSSPNSSPSSSSTPKFTGVYADEYSWAWEQAKKKGSEFAMQALSDGKITESEVQEAADKYVQCMSDKGYTATKFTDGSGDIYHPNQDTSEQWQQQMSKDDDSCNDSSGIIDLAGPFQMQRTNPDKKNDNSMIIACLRKHDVVDDSMTDEQVEQELSAGPSSFNWIPFDAAAPNYDASKATWLVECRNNPREFE